jgi:hypothetical protein
MRVPDWPLDLPSDIADRYREPAEVLYQNRYFHDEMAFDQAINIAIDFCEEARCYGWSEAARRAEADRFAATWPAAATAARRLSDTLKLSEDNAALAIRIAMDKSAVRLRSKEQQKANVALAALLRELSNIKFVKGKASRSLRYHIGPLLLDIRSQKPEFPRPAVVVTIALAHLFRVVKDAPDKRDVTVFHGARLGPFAAWEAAAAFAFAVGMEGSGEELADNAEKWCRRHQGDHIYRGWR